MDNEHNNSPTFLHTPIATDIEALDLATSNRMEIDCPTELDCIATFEKHANEPIKVRTIPNQYRYEPLEDQWQIRLLVLFPGAENDPVQGMLVPIELARPNTENAGDSTPYEALSYCWGDMDNTANIYLSRKEFTVTRSLFNTLKRLRNKPLPQYESQPSMFCCRILWIDAICIDQQNVTERTAQVKLMGHIYSQSNHTLIDVGDGDEASDAIMDAAVEIASTAEVVTGINPCDLIRGNLQRLLFSKNYHLVKEGFESHRSFKEQSNLAETVSGRLLTLPWFGRIWVLQEVLKSPSMPIFRWGQKTVAWGAIVILAVWSEAWSAWNIYPIMERTTRFDMPLELKLMLASRMGMRKLWTQMATMGTDSEFPMLLLLLNSQEFDATDDRDKLFALLGIARELIFSEDELKIYRGLAADYRRSTPMVFAEFTRDMIEKSKSLDILSAAGRLDFTGRRGHPLGCPSWSPTLFKAQASAAITTQVRTSLLLIGGMNSAGDSKPDLHSGIHPAVLRLTGYCFQTIQRVPTNRDPKTNERSSMSFLTWYSDFVGFGVPGIEDSIKWVWEEFVVPLGDSSSHLLLLFLETLTCGSFKVSATDLNDAEEAARERLLSSFAVYWDKIDAGFQSLPAEWRSRLHALKDSAGSEAWRRFKSCISGALGRCFALTTDGQMCLCPPGTQEGDIVAILFGGATPFVLRPLPSALPVSLYPLTRTRKYEFIGECYLHGSMNGEVVKLYELAGIQPVTIDLL